MKCLVLAGGKGDRLWPLSRKNYPKQFIQIQKNHSIFQETIARNIPFCDEFVIVTNREYRFIVENQMKAFQGISYRCVLEEKGRKTTAAIVMGCMQFPMSEIMFVVAADHLIEGEAYKENILRAKELSREGFLVTFGIPITVPDTRFGYIKYEGEDVLEFAEKPNELTAMSYCSSRHHLINSGMFIFQNGELLQELKNCAKDVYDACMKAYRKAYLARNQEDVSSLYLSEEIMEGIPALAIEKTVFEKTRKAKVVHSGFKWKDVGSLEDISDMDIDKAATSMEIQYRCEDTIVINQCKRRVVVANGLKDTMIVNTKDAVYVGKRGKSEALKDIMAENPQMQQYFDSGRISYRHWGTAELLGYEAGFRVKKVTILPGETIYAHKHNYRSEHWTVVQGQACVWVEGFEQRYSIGEHISIGIGAIHQVANIGIEDLIIIETGVGDTVTESDMVTIQAADLSDGELGIAIAPFVKLLPAFKDYLWGGQRLLKEYGKICDYDTIAESWELSAHPSGQSIVKTGRHAGMLFGEYLKTIGKEKWGWKCQPLSKFPILIKFLDASDDLSIQVHPYDDYALEHENEYGKNEMWYILDAVEGGFLYCGFNRAVTREEVAQRLENHTITEVLNKIYVKKGDVYFIPAGTVHAIGRGIMVCEIQQSSDSTYRLYDYDRRDKYGNKRELHIEKALDVLDYSPYEVQTFGNEIVKKEGYYSRTLSCCKYFECTSYQIEEDMFLEMGESSFYSIICLEGSGCIQDTHMETMDFKKGDSIFLPMNPLGVTILGECEIIVTHI